MKPQAAPAPRLDARCLRRALGILAAALVLRVVYYLLIRRTACLDINMDPISDMETFHRWALTIVNGDWLGRGDFHPFHPWQAAVAAKEQWARWYGHVYHQEPLYPYLVALVYLVAPRVPSSMILFQLAAGAAGCAFTYLAARRLAPEGAALAAGVMSALYGPYIYYESLLLRDSWLIPLQAAMLWVVLEARARGGADGGRWWLAGGLLMGLSFITKASVLPFALLLILGTLWEERRGAAAAGGVSGRGSLAMTIGFLAVFFPVAARNLAVGAPVTKITTRGPIEFINGNNPWHIGIGWFDGDDQRVSRYAHDVLARSDGRLAPTVTAVVRNWSGRYTGLIGLQLTKLGYFFAPFEMPNNASYSYFRLNSALLRRATLSFFWISPLALLGLIESFRRPEPFAPVYLFIVCGVATTIAFYVIARFRAPFMPAILIFAGLGLWSLATSARRGAWGRIAASGALAVALFAVNTAKTFPDEDLVRPQDFLISIQGYLTRGMTPEALREAERGRDLFPALADFPRAAARIHLAQGRRAEALAAYRETLARDPSDEEARRQVQWLESPP